MASNLMICTLLLLGASSISGKSVAGWNVPSDWQQGYDYVVVNSASDGTPSAYGGYIFPGPASTSSTSISYVSPNGYYCEAKHYQHNYGVFADQECANVWTALITQGDGAATKYPNGVSNCKTVASYPCGCQQLCRPVNCDNAQINATRNGGANSCNYMEHCRIQEHHGLVTSCAAVATFQISMWYGIIFAVVIAFVAFSMANMPLEWTHCCTLLE